MKKNSNSKRGKLTDWDWTTLVAAWRYYEHRHTIASAMFPGDIVVRFFGPKSRYTDEDRTRIARQFVEVDHSNGVDDFPMTEPFGYCDAVPWRRLYCFWESYLKGFEMAIHKTGGGKLIKFFRCDGKLIPVDEYSKNPYVNVYLDASKVVLT